MAYYGEDRPMRDEDWETFGGLLTKEEFMCKCGKCDINSANNMRHDFMHSLHLLRLAVDKPFYITSGYRCPLHPEEQKKILKGKEPGDHAHGYAADIGGSFDMPVLLTTRGIKFGFNVFGWNHKGDFKGRFTHVAKRKGLKGVLGYTY